MTIMVGAWQQAGSPGTGSVAETLRLISKGGGHKYTLTSKPTIWYTSSNRVTHLIILPNQFYWIKQLNI